VQLSFYVFAAGIEIGRIRCLRDVVTDAMLSERLLESSDEGRPDVAKLQPACLRDGRCLLHRADVVAAQQVVVPAPELSYAIASAVARRQRTAIDAVARKVAALERRVMTSDFRNPEDQLHDMFLVRHELLTVRTMAAQTHDVHARLGRLVSEDDKAYATDLADQFDRVRSVSDGEKEFLFGVIDLYTSRVTTKMTVAMERLAVLAAVTLPITAIASVYGMNVIVNERTHMVQLMLVLAVMAVISAMLLRWTKRQGWW